MSEENNEYEQHVHFVSPEEYASTVRMIGQQNAHTLLEALDTLNEEQVIAVKGVLTMTLKNTHSNGYFQGILAGLLKDKFNLCPGCGVNHAEVPAEWTEKEKETESSTPLTPDEVQTAMEAYGVEPTGHHSSVKCKNCGAVSVSLDDRMLRKPGIDGCEGCQQKAAWG